MSNSSDLSSITEQSPRGWIKLPSGALFAIADVLWLSEIAERWDEDSDCDIIYFFIKFKFEIGTTKALSCVLYNTESTTESSAKLRKQLEQFRDKIAMARWGEPCLSIEDGESANGEKE